ncbi:MAG TPA: hypothetical protein VME46_23315 [Acidimicrobiales bacterium]|nr:hypothetical protein [Acidimicrobiales bacterium]
MHELSLVDELVATCLQLADGRPVLEVWARCPAGTDMDEVGEYFALLARSGPPGQGSCLERAELRLEQRDVELCCTCGFTGALGPDDIAGHIGVCPVCGRASEIRERLEVVAMSFARAEVAKPNCPGPRDQLP